MRDPFAVDTYAASAACTPAASSGAPVSCPPWHCAARTTRRGLRIPSPPIAPPAMTRAPAMPTPRRKASERPERDQDPARGRDCAQQRRRAEAGHADGKDAPLAEDVGERPA